MTIVRTQTFTLLCPVETDGGLVAEVTIRRATVGDFLALTSGGRKITCDFGSIVALASLLSGLPEATIIALDFDDFRPIADAVAAAFIPDVPATLLN